MGRGLRPPINGLAGDPAGFSRLWGGMAARGRGRSARKVKLEELKKLAKHICYPERNGRVLIHIWKLVSECVVIVAVVTGQGLRTSVALGEHVDLVMAEYTTDIQQELFAVLSACNFWHMSCGMDWRQEGQLPHRGR